MVVQLGGYQRLEAKGDRPMVCEYDNRHIPRLVERLPFTGSKTPGGAGTTYQ
jgi:hypothetical protein